MRTKIVEDLDVGGFVDTNERGNWRKKNMIIFNPSLHQSESQS